MRQRLEEIRLELLNAVGHVRFPCSGLPARNASLYSNILKRGTGNPGEGASAAQGDAGTLSF